MSRKKKLSLDNGHGMNAKIENFLGIVSFRILKIYFELSNPSRTLSFIFYKQ